MTPGSENRAPAEVRLDVTRNDVAVGNGWEAARGGKVGFGA